MTRPLVVAVILAQLADWASWLGLPAGAERNAAAAAAVPVEGLVLKAALVVLVLAVAAIADRRRPDVAQVVLIVAIVAGAFGWGTNHAAGLS